MQCQKCKSNPCKCVNWTRIIANAGLAFCSTVAAVSFTGNPDVLMIAVVNALFIAGVAFFTELKSESEGMGKLKKVISTALIV